MTHHAKGSFEVKLTPQPSVEGVGDPSIGRMSITKRFEGDLAATSKGEMLAIRTATDGSAGYVAMERVVGFLGGLEGAFSLQHSGTMRRGTSELIVSVVPDSGTGKLEGLSGTMTITIQGREHFYEFTYTLPDQSG